MNTILTDDALIDAIRKAGLRVIGPHKILARAVEAAVLAKLAQQADRQRVPEGCKVVPVEPTCDMLAAMSGEWHPSRHGKAREQYAAMLAAAPEAPAQCDTPRYCESVQRCTADDERRASTPAQASAVDDDYKGWYCAHCQRGVDAREVTFHEQHEACGRVITEDRPPKAQASAVDERAAFEAWVTERGVAMHYEGDGHYGNATVARWWEAWQARAALAQAEQAAEPVRDERKAFEAWVAKVQPTYWRAEAWQTEAWAMWQSISAALASTERQPMPTERVDELSHEMVRGNKSVNWLVRAIEAAHGIGGEGKA